MSCSEREDSERAIDRLVTRPSMPTATALGSRRRISSRSSSGNGLSGGNWPMKPGTNCTWPKTPGSDQTSKLATAKVINRPGQRGRITFTATPSSTVPRPSNSEGQSTSPA
ncbi:hypothetical protein D3C76_1379510 [compost metagenome]